MCDVIVADRIIGRNDLGGGIIIRNFIYGSVLCAEKKMK